MVVWNKKYVPALLLSALMSPLIYGGDYSLGLDDSANAYDAPVPGFVGPSGDGKAPIEGLGFEDNYVNPVFTGWGAFFDWETPYVAPETDELQDLYRVPGTDYAPVTALLDGFWQYSGEAAGPLDVSYDFPVCSLGDWTSAADAGVVEPGHITMWFPERLHNVPGADLVVYENGFIAKTNQGGAGAGGVFAELAYVEVSTDGVNFARFPSISLTAAAYSRGGSLDPTDVYNLAGKHVNMYGDSWGTPFDLSTLADETNVINGLVDIDNIRFVRIVDIPGNGYFQDSLGNPIYDPFPTSGGGDNGLGSGGADIDAVGTIGQALTYTQWDAGRSLAMLGDDDGDGVPNLLEYAFDMNPLSRDASLLPQVEIVDGHAQLRFRRDVRKNDVRYVVEATDSLTAPDWQPVARAEAFSDPEVLLADPEAATVSTESRHTEASLNVWQEVCFTDLALNAARFYRVRVETVDN